MLTKGAMEGTSVCNSYFTCGKLSTFPICVPKGTQSYRDKMRCVISSKISRVTIYFISLQWHHNDRDGVSNHRRLDCLLSRLFRIRSRKTSKLLVTGLWEGNPPVTVGFPSQRASNAKNCSIWWRHHVIFLSCCTWHSVMRSSQQAPTASHVSTKSRLSTCLKNIFW